MFKKYILLALVVLTFSCKNDKKTDDVTQEEEIKEQVVNLYTHRHYDTDKMIFANFEKETGIKVNVVKANADELIQKMESEGEQSPADVLITVDAGRLVRAKAKGILQGVNSTTLTTTIPEYLRDADGYWFGLTKRARVIVYDKDKVKPEDLTTYEALTDAKWNKKVLIRSSGNIYNQSLMASIIANDGKEKAKEWAEGMVNNFARTPKGNDRDQVKAILAGEGELAVINTYYLGKLLNSKDALEVDAGKAVDVFFPNQGDRGTHINISGIGVAKYAPNKANAVKFIEYLVSKEVQEVFAKANYEYPVNETAQASELLKSWGDFKEDRLPLSKLGELNKEAVVLFDEVKWQ
ncbi:MAG: Fe(3+) ABC transporter substrate-binding protein [Flavobacteriaceae bacterium]|nr:Fe(3+) ABC transporter substrate-binding protein [Flavobacteriaceae bacterium]